MRSRINRLVLATTSTIVVSFVVPLCLLVRTLAEDRAMAAADQEARNVAIIVAGLDSPRQLTDIIGVLDDGVSPSTSVLTADGRQIGPGPAMTADPDVARALKGEAFREISDGRGRVLLPVVVDGGTAVVRSTVDPDALQEGVRRAWAGIIGLGLVLLLVAALAARGLGRRISEPLRDVATTAHQLREGDLAARAEVTGTEETRELARALNGLAERTTELLASERAAVGDLSHRLRTPVTALRLDAEAVADPALAGRLQEHIGVLQRTVDSIVAEARRPVRRDLSARCDAAEVVAERVAFWSVLAEDQGRALRVVLADGPLTVGVSAEDLRDVVDVVVDNVFAHTAQGVGFEVSLGVALVRAADHDRPAPADDGGSVVLRVADAGPGFAPTPAGRPGTSGLGLDLAARVAGGVGGALTRGRSEAGGALVELRLPRLDG